MRRAVRFLALGAIAAGCVAHPPVRAPRVEPSAGMEARETARTYTLETDWRTDAGPLVVAAQDGKELFRVDDVIAFDADDAGRVWVARRDGDAFKLERFDGDGHSRWSLAVDGSFRASDLVLYRSRGALLASWNAEQSVRRFVQVDAERGTDAAYAETPPFPTLAGERQRICSAAFGDGSGVLWCVLGDAEIARFDASGAVLSRASVGGPRASADEGLPRTWLTRSSDGAIAFSSDGRVTAFGAAGEVRATRSLGAPLLGVVSMGEDTIRVYPERVERVSATGATAWTWAPPSGRVLASGASSGSIDLTLSTGLRLDLDARTGTPRPGSAASVTSASGLREPGPNDLDPPRAQPRLSYAFTRVAHRPRVGRKAGRLIPRRDGSFLDVESSGDVLEILSDGAVRAASFGAAPERLKWSALSVLDLPDHALVTAVPMGDGGIQFDAGTVLDAFRLDASGSRRTTLRPVMGPSFREGEVKTTDGYTLAFLAAATFQLGSDVWACVATREAFSRCRVRDARAPERTSTAADEDWPFIVHSVVPVGDALVVAALVPESRSSDTLITRVKVRKRGEDWVDLALGVEARVVRLVARALDDVWLMTQPEYGLYEPEPSTGSAYENAALYHWDGEAWSTVALPVTDATDFASPAPGELVVVGASGVATRSSGVWTEVVGAPRDVRALAVSPGGVVGLFTRDAIFLGVPQDPAVARDAWADGVVTRPDPRSPSLAEMTLVPSTSSVSAAPPIGDAPSPWRACERHACRSADGTPVGALDAVRSVGAAPSGGAWVATATAFAAPTIHAIAPDGRVTDYPKAPDDLFVDISARSDTDVWFAGGLASGDDPPSDWPQGEGSLVHFDGSAFTRIAVERGALLTVDAAQDDVWAAGLGGVVVRVTRDSAVVWQLPGGAILRDVLVVAPNDVWIVGDRSTVLHFDGARFESVTRGLPSRLSSFTSVTRVDGHVRIGGPGGALEIADAGP